MIATLTSRCADLPRDLVRKRVGENHISQSTSPNSAVQTCGQCPQANKFGKQQEPFYLQVRGRDGLRSAATSPVAPRARWLPRRGTVACLGQGSKRPRGQGAKVAKVAKGLTPEIPEGKIIRRRRAPKIEPSRQMMGWFCTLDAHLAPGTANLGKSTDTGQSRFDLGG